MNCVRIYRSYEKPAVGNDETAQFALELVLPCESKAGWDSGLCITAACRFMAIGRPIVRIFDICDRNCRLGIYDLVVCRAAFVSVIIRSNLQGHSIFMFRSQGTESAQLCLGVARAIVGRSVNKSVAGHDSVKTAASYPVVCSPVLSGDINEFDAGPGRHNKLLGCLGAIASMMEPVCIYVGWELSFDLACVNVPSCKDARMTAARGSSGPGQAIDYKKVVRTIVPGRFVIGCPQCPACLGREGGQRSR